MTDLSLVAGYRPTLPQAAPVMREATMKSKTYQATMLGEEATRYLAAKRKRQAQNTQDAYESSLHKFCIHFADLGLNDFEPPAGVELLEAFLDHFWGDAAPGTYNRHHSALKAFFEFCVDRERMRVNPMRKIERAKERQIERTTFTVDHRAAILAAQESLRDRLALRLLFDCGLRRGSLAAVQFKHFDHQRRRLTIFAKGGKVRAMPISDPAFWLDLERHILDSQAQPVDYLLPGSQGRRVVTTRQMTGSGVHHWWYRCLERAGLVAKGLRSGEHLHKTRHSFGQRILDKTGNLKAAQVGLGHSTIQTTGDHYVDHDIDQLTVTLDGLWDDE